MKSGMEQDNWEKRLDRELKSLPLMKAPEGLSERVMAAVAARAAVPQQRSWMEWSRPVRLLSASLLWLLFAGICLLVWKAPAFGPVASGLESVRNGLASGGMWLGVLEALGGACRLAVRSLGNGFLMGCAVAAGMAYVACVGLGTAYLRLALGRR